jgi:hypothetical protein
MQSKHSTPVLRAVLRSAETRILARFEAFLAEVASNRFDSSSRPL